MSMDFEARMQDAVVARDTRTLADLTEIFCKKFHGHLERSPAQTRAALLGVYGPNPPMLCADCHAHLEYGEKRRAFCPKDPKPFCAHCDTHCYARSEAEWHREMMRFAGPRSMLHGHAVDGVKHMIEARRHKRADARAN